MGVSLCYYLRIHGPVDGDNSQTYSTKLQLQAVLAIVIVQVKEIRSHDTIG